MRLTQLPQLKNLLLAVLLLGLCCYTALSAFVALVPVDGDYTTILLTKANYAGFVAVAACCISYFFAPQFFRLALGFALLLSVFHLVNFLPTSIDAGLHLGEISIGIEPFCLLLLVGYYFLNRTSGNSFIRRYLLPPPTPEKAARLHREAVDQFKQNFARKTDEGLRQIVQDRKLVADAVIAAQELLHERNAKAGQTPS